MKESIQTCAFYVFWICFVGFLASSVWGIMSFFAAKEGFFELSFVKYVINSFFNWIFGMCLTFLVVEKE